MRISRWNGRDDRLRKTTSVAEGMDRAEGNCRSVGGKGLAEKNY